MWEDMPILNNFVPRQAVTAGKPEYMDSYVKEYFIFIAMGLK